MKKKKETINPKKVGDKCFQYAANVALSYEEIKWNPERVSNIKSFINKYNWKGINYPSKINNWKRLRKIIQQLLLILYILKEKEYVHLIFQKLIGIVKNK